MKTVRPRAATPARPAPQPAQRTRTTVGRAELLLALQASRAEPAAGLRVAALLGFEPVKDDFKDVTALDGKSDDGSARTMPVGLPTVAAATASPPTRQALLWEVVHCDSATPHEPTPTGRASPLDAADCGPEVAGALPPPLQPLVRPQRLWPALRSSVSGSHAAGLDLPRLLRHLAAAEHLPQWPLRRRRHWAGPLWVVWDRADHLAPYEHDFRLMLDLLRRLRGLGDVTVFEVDGTPGHLLRTTTLRPSAGLKRMPTPPSDACVLVLGDLGALRADDAGEHAWLRWAKAWQQAGAQVVAWCCQGARQVPQALACALPVHMMQGAQHLRPQRGSWRNQDQRAAEHQRLAALLDDLLVRASCAVICEAALLRRLRGQQPALRAEPALEALAWGAQPKVDSSRLSRPLVAGVAATYRARLALLPTAAQVAVLQAMQWQHQAQGRSTPVMEALLWHTHASPAARQAAQALPVLERSRQWIQRLADTVALAPAGDPGVASFARDVLARQGHDAAWWGDHARPLAALWAVAAVAELPPGLDPGLAHSARARHGSAAPRHCCLAQQGAQLWLCPADEVLPPRWARVGADFVTGTATWVTGQGAGQWLDVSQLPAALGLSAADTSALLLTDGLQLRLSALARPAWAHEFGRDRHGLYADLRVASVTQRLRWIPPGEGWLGSTPEERARRVPAQDLKQYSRRYERESPRHRVRLTQGFWLADTACTQALWLAVLGGKNPSQFADDPVNPVESVSFDDVQGFLDRLARNAPGAAPALPTEAQWEYACRAGSGSAYHFGEEASQEHMNVDQRHQGPVQVKRYASNAWGLYDMHGNVWEWCCDADRAFSAELALDPVGRRDDGPEAPRAVRGGSWISRARLARSACRRHYQRGRRDEFLGFRFALRSTSPAQPGAPEVPGLKAAAPPSGPGAAPPGPAGRDARRSIRK